MRLLFPIIAFESFDSGCIVLVYTYRDEQRKGRSGIAFRAIRPAASEVLLTLDLSLAIIPKRSRELRALSERAVGIRDPCQTMILTIDQILEAALRKYARQQGVAPESLALDTLREKFTASAPIQEAENDWERALLGVGTDCGASLSHAALSSEELYV